MLWLNVEGLTASKLDIVEWLALWSTIRPWSYNSKPNIKLWEILPQQIGLGCGFTLSSWNLPTPWSTSSWKVSTGITPTVSNNNLPLYYIYQATDKALELFQGRLESYGSITNILAKKLPQQKTYDGVISLAKIFEA